VPLFVWTFICNVPEGAFGISINNECGGVQVVEDPAPVAITPD